MRCVHVHTGVHVHMGVQWNREGSYGVRIKAMAIMFLRDRLTVHVHTMYMYSVCVPSMATCTSSPLKRE